MKIKDKIKRLVKEGFLESSLLNFNEKEINILMKKFTNEQVLTTKGVTMVSSKNPNAPEIAKDLNSKGVNVSMTEIEEVEEVEEKDEKKNPWAICHAQLGPRKNAKFESCVRQVKKSLSEGKNPLSLFIEEKITEMVSKHIPPKITKGDLIKYLEENDTKPAPTKDPKTKPGTKEPPSPKKNPSHPGKNPNPKVLPGPKAISPEDAKNTIIDTIVKILKNG